MSRFEINHYQMSSLTLLTALKWNELQSETPLFIDRQDLTSQSKNNTIKSFVKWYSPSVWADEAFRVPPFQLNTMNVMLPFSFKDWLDRQRPALDNDGPIDIFGAQFETEVVWVSTYNILMINQTDYTLGQSFLMLQWKMLSNSTSDEMLLNKKML